MMSKVKVFTIGFTKKTAEEFFCRLIRAGVKRVIDIRLNNVSQLAGFAKRDDLRYFLRTIVRIWRQRSRSWTLSRRAREAGRFTRVTFWHCFPQEGWRGK